MTSDIWQRIVREETHFCHYIGYSFKLAARDLLYAVTLRQDGTYGLLYQLWSTGWNEKYLNGSTMRDRSDDSLHTMCR